MPEDAEIHDPLDDSPILEEVLGEALPRLRKFHVKLFTEGEPRGLIGPRDVGILWERHILNSAAIVPFIRREIGKTNASIADVGSGGGFPGIVAAACMPEHRCAEAARCAGATVRRGDLQGCGSHDEIDRLDVADAQAPGQPDRLEGAFCPGGTGQGRACYSYRRGYARTRGCGPGRR